MYRNTEYLLYTFKNCIALSTRNKIQITIEDACI